jgi:hypothetical protein
MSIIYALVGTNRALRHSNSNNQIVIGDFNSFRFFWDTLYNLTDEEFYKETGAWIYNSVNSLLNESRDLFKDIIESPDKVNDCYENLAYDFLESKYWTIKQSGSNFSDIKHKGFSILHCNIRSLSKNLTLLTDVLLAVKELPNIIAISLLLKRSSLKIVNKI